LKLAPPATSVAPRGELLPRSQTKFFIGSAAKRHRRSTAPRSISVGAPLVFEALGADFVTDPGPPAPLSNTFIPTVPRQQCDVPSARSCLALGGAGPLATSAILLSRAGESRYVLTPAYAAARDRL